MKGKRERIWVDRFQTRLSIRIVVYFLVYHAVVLSLILVGWDLWGACQNTLGPEAAGYVVGIGVTLFAYVVLLFLYDAMTFSHRVVGPLYRIRKMIQAVTTGEAVERLQLRKGDFLQELKDDLNEMLQSLEQRGAVVLKSGEPVRVP
jgi:hypothetical protein